MWQFNWGVFWAVFFAFAVVKCVGRILSIGFPINVTFEASDAILSQLQSIYIEVGTLTKSQRGSNPFDD